MLSQHVATKHISRVAHIVCTFREVSMATCYI
nr:MAG TPA: hypothetical protein [Caudoviricetes sp.]